MLQQLLEGDNTLNGNERVGIHFLAPGPEDTASHTPISPDSSIGSTPKVPVENTKGGTKISTQLNPSSPAPNGRREHVKPFKLYNDAMTIQYIVPINQIAEETVGSHECREHELTPVWVRQAEAALDEYPTFYVCENYLHFRTCPSGSRCSQVHISTNNANITRVPIHVNRPESLKKHTSLQAGKQITVFDRATGRSQTYGTENVLCTKGSSDWVAGYHCGRRVYHCKHFFRMSLCTRAEQCAFIHVVGTHRNTANTGFSQHQAQIYQYPSGTTSQPHIITNADMFNTTQLQFLQAQQNKLVNSAISNDRTSSLPAAPFFSNSHPLINQLTVPFLTGPNALSVQQPQITQPYLTNYQVNRATNGYSIVPTQSSVTTNSMQSLIPLYGFQSNDGKVETTNSTSQITSSATSNLGGGMFSNTTNSNVKNANTTTQSNPSISQGQIPAVASNLPTSQSTSNSQILYAVPMQQSSQPTNGTGMDTWILNPNSVQQQQQQQLVYILVPGMNVSQ